MRYSKILKLSISEGPGCRCVLFTCGCFPNKCAEGHCPGCHNPELHDFDVGELFTEESLDMLVDCLSRPQIAGLTLCGGEVLDQDIDELLNIVRTIKMKFPTKTIWLYTGYQWEDLVDVWVRSSVFREFASYIDVAVIGPYVQSLRDITANNAFRGSINQQLVDIQESLKLQKMVCLKYLPDGTFAKTI